MIDHNLTEGPKARSVQQADRSWSIVDEEMGVPIEASGRELSGLSRKLADDIAAQLNAVPPSVAESIA